MNKIDQEIILIAKQVQMLLDEKYLDSNDMLDFYTAEPVNGYAGLKNGSIIIEDYVMRGENGVAIQHLIYMMQESSIKFTNQMIESISNLSKQFDIKF
jgi:hypothetical protein